MNASSKVTFFLYTGKHGQLQFHVERWCSPLRQLYPLPCICIPLWIQVQYCSTPDNMWLFHYTLWYIKVHELKSSLAASHRHIRTPPLVALLEDVHIQPLPKCELTFCSILREPWTNWKAHKGWTERQQCTSLPCNSCFIRWWWFLSERSFSVPEW